MKTISDRQNIQYHQLWTWFENTGLQSPGMAGAVWCGHVHHIAMPLLALLGAHSWFMLL